MSKTPQKIAQQLVRKYAKALKKSGFDIQMVFLYGSFARGNPHADSDIDVAIVSKSLVNDREEKEKLLWHHTLAIDSRIEPVAYTSEEFVPLDPLVWEIKKDGVEIKRF